LYAPGVILFALAKREQDQPLFTHVEKGIFSCVIAGAGLAAYGLYSGVLSL
jgi:arginine:ornithine antiporter/lysine permease